MSTGSRTEHARDAGCRAALERAERADAVQVP
jgi:hypothetical protein